MDQAKRGLKISREQIFAIIGMAMVWPSIHNQLLYPITFSFHKEGAFSSYLCWLAYSAILLVATLGMFWAGRKGKAERVLSNRAVMVGVSCVGSVGIGCLVLCDFNIDLAWLLMGIGIGFSAVFIPFMFAFWSLQLVYASQKRAAYDLLLSYVLFCVITAIRLGFGLHAWMFSIAYPLVSAVLAYLILQHPTKSRFASGPTRFSEMPTNLLIPCVLLVYLATASRCMVNPLSATQDYPPDTRVLVYISVGLLALVVAILYRPRGKLRNSANMLVFAITVIILIGAVLVTGMGMLGAQRLGNFPTIAGLNFMEVFIWVLVLSNAQSKHTGIVQASAAYLIGVIGVTHLASVLYVGSRDLLSLEVDVLPILITTVVLAFLAVAIVIGVMAAMIFKSTRHPQAVFPAAVVGVSSASVAPAAPNLSEDPGTFAAPVANAATAGSPLAASSVTGASGAPAASTATPPSAPVPVAPPPCMTMAADEAAYRRIQETFRLSRRETDTLRLAARNKSAKEIAEDLFVAESTVNSHIKGIYRKCDVHSRQELIALVNRFKKEETL
ncbi:helix-turn-helix transcriptional regulator [Adlercreutzia equolifaciens]|uniref:helix-turn-helix transcriptional regulator n=1 Tax=Adlercreutzia equolifaciens TaxID=446660 RepID=UPI0023B07C38|nr:helix-turn-helix transcriptional regulator [Adlercreutzia equolifaciens]MDE8701405.1 helix-turn-helix transcriptional regulator [Adlercreutzia equolifaciens]